MKTSLTFSGPRQASAEVLSGAVIVAAVTLLLGAGFVPGSRTLFGFLADAFSLPEQAKDYCGILGFPVLAYLFSLSAIDQKAAPGKSDPGLWLRISVVPCIVAIIHSAVTSPPPLFTQLEDPRTVPLFIWFAISAPIGEEILFRKWLYSWLERWYGNKLWPDTNPLPVAVWLSALGFSLWHIQNVGVVSTGSVAWQIFYTFFAGLWLGLLRQRSGRVWPGVIAHVFINAVS